MIKLIHVTVALQEWIMEQWDKNFYITSIAGSNNGSSLVVMSKGLIAKGVTFCCGEMMNWFYYFSWLMNHVIKYRWKVFQQLQSWR